jgi:hypothetical protein
VDEDSDKLILSAKLGAYLTGNERNWLNNRFSLTHLLEKFSADVFPLSTEHIVFNSYFEANRAGRLNAEVPDWLIQASKPERRQSKSDRVEFATGEPWTAKKSSKALRAIRCEAATLAAEAGCQETKRLLDYLNGLAPNAFAKVTEKLEEAHRIVDTLSSDVERQHNLLMAIEQVCQPIYKPVESSVRVYSLNESFLRLKREVRNVITEDWLKADLTSAQLAIAATFWSAPKVSHFLESGNSIWTELQQWMKVQHEPESKPKLKELLYSLLFGMKTRNLARKLKEMFPNLNNPWLKFKQHTLIAELLEARKLQFERIRTAGEVKDAFGRTLRLQEKGKSDSSYQDDNASSLLAQVAQSWELKLMLPILDLAENHRKSNGFTVTMWLHDGVCISVHDKRRMEDWKARISNAVNTEAEKLNIPTRLVWD